MLIVITDTNASMTARAKYLHIHLKDPLLNHLTLEKTKQNFSSTLMLQAGCIYLGLITPCPETYHPLHPPRRLITPCPTTNVISTKEYSKYPTWLTLLLSLPQTSLLALSPVVRPTVAPPCLNKGNLLLLRSSFLFCLAGTVPYKGRGGETGEEDSQTQETEWLTRGTPAHKQQCCNWGEPL